ncbi:nucleotide sugar transporter SLC35D2 isoform X2 [Athene noctua]|uniref:nucleotide sugar transporter SLC35D2 isoform X2 n=1 Tax=Athene noctua TaxID=126797 RepID=UPI003EBCB314
MSAGQAGGEAAGATAPSALPRVLSALFYGACSFLIVLVNKALLSAYRFPSPMFLGIGQMAATILILYVSKINKIVHFPDFDKSIPVKLFPLPLIYVGNHISGLSSTSKLSLPMFTVLRKFTIPLTLLLEIIILGKRYPLSIIVSVFAIILGAFIAAGFLLMYSTVLCSHYNSALTTTVVGAIKNISIAYVGMLIGGDYIFSVLNFIGLNICMVGGLRYSFLTLRGSSKPVQPGDEENALPVSKS